MDSGRPGLMRWLQPMSRCPCMLESGAFARTQPGPSGLEKYWGANRMPSPVRSLFRVIKWLIVAAVVIALCLLLWGGDLLIAGDPLPEHLDAAIVLQGSIAAEKVRIAGAIDLLRQGVAD